MASPATQVDIDEVVRRVLAAIRSTTSTTEPPASTNHNKQIFGKVISTEQIKDVAADTTLRIAGNSVITPAARDVLRDRNVRIETAELVSGGSKPALLLAIGAPCPDRALIEVLERDNTTIETTKATGVNELVGSATNHVVSTQGRAALITSDTAAAVCLANRSTAIRAAHVRSPADLTAAINQLDPNVLVICPIGKSLAQLATIISNFVQYRPPTHANR